MRQKSDAAIFLPFLTANALQMLFDEFEELGNIAKVIGIQLREVFLGSSFCKDQITATVAVGALLFEISRKGPLWNQAV